jgi:hypothetical protein
MATTNIKIKYFADFPVHTYYDDFELPEARIIDYKYAVPKTSEPFGHVTDGNRAQRNIQIVCHAVYQVEFITGKNLDWYKLQNTNHVLVTPVDEEPFIATNVRVTYSQTDGNMDSYCVIQFEKQLYIKDELSSAFVELMKVGTNSNSIDFDVKNPSFVFNNINVYSSSGTSYIAYFNIPLNDLTDKIQVGDTFYLHTDNNTFDALQDITPDYLSFARCTSKTSDELIFKCSNQPVTPPTPISYDIVNLTIDHISDGRDLPAGETVANKTISFNIYTFIEPIFRHETELVEGLKYEDGREENQVTIERDIAYFKVWLRESEKWKAEYLNYALNNDILINLHNYDNIVPSQTKDIIMMADNPRLIDMFEYDVKVIYNIKKVNINR